MLAIRLSAEIESRLDLLAKKTGRTKTFYAREAILAHLEDLEDYYLSAETAARACARSCRSEWRRCQSSRAPAR